MACSNKLWIDALCKLEKHSDKVSSNCNAFLRTLPTSRVHPQLTMEHTKS